MSEKEPLQKGAMRGVCHIFFETGYEGSCLAFQDERCISKVSPSYGIWGNETVWDSANPARKGKTKNDAEVFKNNTWRPLPDPLQNDPDYFKSSLYCGEERGDREADKRLMDKYGFVIKYAADRMNEDYGERNWRLESPSTAVTSDGTRVFFGGTPNTEPEQRPYGVSAGALTRATVEWEDGAVEQRLSNSLLVRSFSYEGLHILKSGDELTVYDKSNPSRIVWNGIIQLRPNTKHPGCPIQKGVQLDEWKRWFSEEYPATLVKL